MTSQTIVGSEDCETRVGPFLLVSLAHERFSIVRSVRLEADLKSG
jgi:hypothetical protein